jgi:patatin-like phospholipase/acyl hydrolase
MKKVRILSLDGGGIRGILPGIVLERLEQKLQEKTGNPQARLADFFDLMAGTSTGGILSLAYLNPGSDGRPKLTAGQALDLYLKKGTAIFSRTFRQKVKSKGGITDEKYNAQELENALQETFGNQQLKNLLKPCVISSYDIQNAKPLFFKQHKAYQKSHNFKVTDVARATSAAPTYFETALVNNENGQSFALIDGGVFVNNPALAAYSEARSISFSDTLDCPGAKDMMLVSIGTGASAKNYPYQEAKDWGALGWIKPIIGIMMNGNAQTVHYHLRKIYDTLSNQDAQDYHRLDPEIVKADEEMDNAKEENIKALEADGRAFVSKAQVDLELDTIAEKLIAYGL